MMSVASLNVGRHSVVAPAVLFVPGGRFRMGSEAGRPDEWPVHDAQVRPVRMGREPVTNLEYAWFLASGRVPEPPWWKDPAFWDPEQPVVGVTSDLITSRLRDVHGVTVRSVIDVDDACAWAAEVAREGDLWLTQGAGDIARLAGPLLEALGGEAVT